MYEPHSSTIDKDYPSAGVVTSLDIQPNVTAAQYRTCRKNPGDLYRPYFL